MDNNNKALYDKIAYVNYLISSSDVSMPPYSFQLRNSAEAIKINRQCGWSALACGISVLGMKLFRWDFFSVSGIILAALCFICAIFSFIYSACMEKAVIAEADGDNITIKGRTYNCGEIEGISKYTFNNLRLMSGGRCILTLNKSCDGCGDLIRWAKQYNIPINDDSSENADNLKKKQAILVIFILVISFAAALIIFFLKMK